MRTLLPLLVAVAGLPAHSRSARADAELDLALALHRLGWHAEAVAVMDAQRAQWPAAARLTRWSIPFGGRPVPVVLIGEKHLVITTDGYRRGDPAPPAGEVTGSILDDRTGGYDFDTLITCYDAVTGKHLWTRRAPGYNHVAIDDRTDTVYAWREKLFRLKPATGETEKTVDLPRGRDRVEALVIAGRLYIPRPGRHPSSDDKREIVQSYDVDTGRVAERDRLMPVRLSPDERRVLSLTTQAVSGNFPTSISVRPLKEDKATWTYQHPSSSYNEPFWLDGDVVALIGNEVTKAEVVRLGGADGKVKWRFELPRGAYRPGGDQLPGNAYPERTWRAIGPCGDYLLAIGGEGSLYFLDPTTGKLAAKASPTTTHLAFPRLVEGALVVCAIDGARAIPWDVLLRKRANDEGDLAALRVRCRHALGKTTEALTELDELLALDPQRSDVWALKADLCKAAGQELDEVAARCRHLELTGRDSSPELRDRWGLIKRIATGHDLRVDLKAAGDTVYAGTGAGWQYRIDGRSLAVERTEHRETVAQMFATERVKALFYGGVWRDLGGQPDPERPPPAQGPPEWRTTSGYDGLAVRWGGKQYRPAGGGSVRVLDGDSMTEHKTRLGPIRRWQIHVSPWGPLGYGDGGVYELDENLCPVRKLIASPRGHEVSFLASDARTLGLLTYTGKSAVLQVWTRDGSRMVREQRLVAPGSLSRWVEPLRAVGGGYLLAAGEVTWVPAAEAGRAWRFGFGDKPGRALPKIHYAHAPLFGTPLVRDNLLFVGCRDGAVYVFDLNAITRR